MQASGRGGGLEYADFDDTRKNLHRRVYREWREVPTNQTEVMVEASRCNGNAFGYFLFAGEQHGFRQAANIKAASMLNSISTRRRSFAPDRRRRYRWPATSAVGEDVHFRPGPVGGVQSNTPAYDPIPRT
jgi:hypothetical protein